MRGRHVPVLLDEVLRVFDPQPGEFYIDGTVNGGGHAKAILKKIGIGGGVLGIDWDCELVQSLLGENINNLIVTCDNYANIRNIAAKYNFNSIAGILLDLGFSSRQLEESGRGFSFLREEPLDMRYSTWGNDLTAAAIVNTWDEKLLEKIFREFGEERRARVISREIIRARFRKRIVTTVDLVEIILKSTPRGWRRSRIHPATRVFQALRMTVNSELDNLSSVLPSCLDLLRPGGRLAVISFHSLEDRIVKRFFIDSFTKGRIKVLTPKPIVTSRREWEENPRSRSAKFRAAEVLK